MREIIFTSEFWPKLHTKIQTANAISNLHIGYNFWDGFVKAISTLSAYNIDMLNVNFDEFPLVTGLSNSKTQNRTISVVSFDLMDDIKLHWNLDGDRIKIIDVVFPQGYLTSPGL
jgi:hypothetical protein